MKLKKEFFLVLFIIISIIVLEILTDYISKKSIDNIYRKIDHINLLLEELKTKKEQNVISKNEKENLNEKIKKLKNIWKDEKDKLSYFSEHDELEKITKCIIALEENAKNEEYVKSLEDGKEFLYWLEIVKEKDKLSIKEFQESFKSLEAELVEMYKEDN